MQTYTDLNIQSSIIVIWEKYIEITYYVEQKPNYTIKNIIVNINEYFVDDYRLEVLFNGFWECFAECKNYLQS